MGIAYAQSASLGAYPNSVSPGRTVTANWSQFNPSGNDWISMHPVDVPDSNYLDWHPISGDNGQVNFTAPSTPGWYNFRLFRNGEYITRSNSFQVVLPGPSVGPTVSQVIFNPQGSANVGQDVGIHIRVESSNPGAIRIYTPCGSVAPFETTVPEFDATWSTGSCGAGGQNVRVCARSVADTNWANPYCTDNGYTLNQVSNAGVSADFWSDAETINSGQCTNLHWQSSGANAVNIDGTGVALSGSMNVCPTVTKHYSLEATGPGGRATRNLSVVVVETGGGQAASGNQSGGMDVGGYCAHLGYPRVEVNRSDAHSFTCAGDNGSVGIDMYDLCAWEFGEALPYPGLQDPNDAWTWSCNSAPVNVPNQTTTGGGTTVTHSNNSSNGNSASSNSEDTRCPAAVTRLSVGDIALVSDYDPYPLNVRATGNISASVMFQIPIREQFTVISGPVCHDGYRWYEIGYSGRSGWAAEVGRNGIYNMVRNGQPLPGSSNTVSQTNNQSSQGSSAVTCSGALPPRMIVGQAGRVTYGYGPTGLRDRPQGSVTERIPEGGVFTVLDGPTCTTAQQGHLNWWHVRTDAGHEGWMPEGYVNGPYWIEPVSGSQVTEQLSAARVDQFVTVEVENWGQIYRFQVDPSNCSILNGSDIVAQEISRFSFSMSRSNSSLSRLYDSIVYFSENSGEIEQFRLEVTNRISNSAHCGAPYYVVGSRTMDMSGLGNIVFGFIAEEYFSMSSEDFISNLAQAANRESFGHYGDNPDDLSQRRTGRLIAQMAGHLASISSASVESAAEQSSLQ